MSMERVSLSAVVLDTVAQDWGIRSLTSTPESSVQFETVANTLISVPVAGFPKSAIGILNVREDPPEASFIIQLSTVTAESDTDAFSELPFKL